MNNTRKTREAGGLAAVFDQEFGAAICTTCGTQYAPGTKPENCPICRDDRQYVPPTGQSWTSMGDLVAAGHRVEMREIEDDLYGLSVEPSIAIGQRALLVRTPEGNLLWDATPLVTEEVVSQVERLGGLKAIAPSHPHFFTGMVAWSRAFGGVPIHLPESARPWVMRQDASIEYYKGDSKELFGGLSLHRTGGHFDCSQVALWPGGAGGKGALFSTDEPAVTPGLDRVSFMYSFPNAIPLDARRLRRVLSVLEPLDFDRIYAGWWGKVIAVDARSAVEKSAGWYLDALEGELKAAGTPRHAAPSAAGESG